MWGTGKKDDRNASHWDLYLNKIGLLQLHTRTYWYAKKWTRPLATLILFLNASGEASVRNPSSSLRTHDVIMDRDSGVRWKIFFPTIAIRAWK